MNQPQSLFLQALGRFDPAQMITILSIADLFNSDLRTPVLQSIDNYGFTLEEMVNRNLDYGGWWGLPGPISVHTFAQEE